jgi:hypothetical protein
MTANQHTTIEELKNFFFFFGFGFESHFYLQAVVYIKQIGRKDEGL